MEKNLILDKFKSIIDFKLGIILTIDKTEVFMKSLSLKSKLFSKLKIEEYFNIIQNNSVESNLEWKIILETLNITETYFFRDYGQINVIEKNILPDIINLNKNEKFLNIWSAGCSTGEEVYTISILLNQIIMDILFWKIKILGTDLNQESIQKAIKGDYFSWSFRNLQTDLINQFFTTKKEIFSIKDNLRNITEFKNENLLESYYKSQFDLIICRNVFIYLNEETKKKILINFESALKPNGYLILGHSEIGNYKPISLEPVIFPNSIVYKKKDKQIIENKTLNSNNSDKIVFNQKNNSEVKLNSNINKEEESLLKAKNFANEGKFSQAKNECNLILALNPNHYEAIYLLGHISESENDFLSAIKNYKNTILKNPDFLEAYLNLASVYNVIGNQNDSRNIRNEGLKILNSNPKLKTYYEKKGYNMKSFESFLSDESSIWI